MMQQVSMSREQLTEELFDLQRKIQMIACTTSSYQPTYLPNYVDDELMIVDEKDCKECCDLIEKIVRGCDSYEESYLFRRVVTNELTWGVPNYETIQAICSFFADGRTIEIGSGLGFWSVLCMMNGLKVDCIYDDHSSHQSNSKQLEYPLNQRYITTGPLTDFDFDNVLIVWPSGERSGDEFNHAVTPVNDITNGNIKPKRIVFCGERIHFYEDGTTDETSTLTGSIEFHKILHTDYELVNNVNNPSWNSIYDSTFFYQRKEGI